jgi:hypothetical protein
MQNDPCRFSAGKQALLGLLLFLPAAFAAGLPTSDEAGFCGRAQQIIAQTELEATVEIPADYDSFVESKSLAYPLTVQQYSSNPAATPEGLHRVISCKMKTAGRINGAREEAGIAGDAARGDLGCETVHKHMLQTLRDSIPPGELRLQPEELVVDDEELTYMGPMWLKPWPFTPVARDGEGRLHLQTRALYVPYAWWIPMPERFKGTYYCHLVHPAYLEALLRGEALVEP